MKAHVETTTYLELRLVSNCTIECQGQTITLEGRQDAAVLVLVTLCDHTILSQEIVAVTLDVATFLRLRSFARADGGITLHRDLG